MTPAKVALYAQAVFRGAPLPAGWPADFAIITAWNPWGATVALADNERADATLHGEILAAGLTPHRVVGGSVDPTGHQEPGWAVAAVPDQARAWGVAFRQDAVFLVQAGRLRLLACVTGQEIDLGRPFTMLDR